MCLRVHALRWAGAGSASKAESLPFSDGQGLQIAADVALGDIIKSALDFNQRVEDRLTSVGAYRIRKRMPSGPEQQPIRIIAVLILLSTPYRGRGGCLTSPPLSLTLPTDWNEKSEFNSQGNPTAFCGGVRRDGSRGSGDGRQVCLSRREGESHGESGH